jgi:hypothetical protein
VSPTSPYPLRSALLTLALLSAPLSLEPASAKPGEPRTLAIQPAQVAIPLGDAVFAFSPDMRSVLAFSPSGARLWRVGLGDQGGAKDLRALGPSLIAYAGQEALALDPQTGKVLGRRPSTLPDPEQPEAGCELAHRDGACALRCACSFELVRCDTLETIGPKVTLPSLAPVGDATKARCPSYTGALLGRAGDALIASAPVATDTPFFGVAEEAVAVSATTGEVLWRSKALGRLDPQLSGVSEDRASCFAGSRAGSVQVFDCQRATPRWRRDISIVKTIEPQVFAAGELLIVRDGRTLRGLALVDGKERWALELAPRTVAWPSRGAAPSLWGSRPDTLALFELVSATPPRREATLPLPSGLNSSPLMSDHLIVALGREDLVVHDRLGEPLLTTGRRKGQLPILAGPALVFAGSERVELFTFEAPSRALTLRAAFEGPLARSRPIALFSDAQALRLALLRDGKGGWDPSDPNTFGELHFVAVELAPNAAPPR